MVEMPDDLRDFFRKAGRQGGKKAAAKMTKAERVERARKASAKAAAIRTAKRKAK